MRPIIRPLLVTLLATAVALPALPTPALAQGLLPGMGAGVGGALDKTLDPLADTARQAVTGFPADVAQALDASTMPLARIASTLAQARLDRLGRLLRQNPATIERDAQGDLARKGELLIMAPDAAALDQARGLGFAVLGEERLAALDLAVTRLAVPTGLPLAKAQALLDKALPGATVSADVLHFPAGAAPRGNAPAHGGGMPPLQTPVGMIDGAPAQGVDAVQGFAPGAPAPSDHGSAVAGLLARAGVRHVLAADVYGRGPAGGNALAIARAVDWLIGRQVRVITISLVGPANPVLARAMTAALQRGAVIVAAVGNDGPAAPPAYPASYPGVLAVTAVDARNRALIEAGRALHLDYAAPGAGLRAANAAGQMVPVRGTSFAAPLVASRVAAARDAHASLPQALDREAIDLGPRGPDSQYGRGLLCTICR
ncbi:S8 family serine peptidase [Novosphingobium pokkalii]|uniref:S8 family serine peptidase n=1 Tax=Novosphingobium pokkalii TaxID=1770194 RepID=A0ABV7V4W6_9SPHN|nr:S8 family serine peptidase [Novosphingobium pokkalii]GHC83476.1 hypothetical protein GCM10019060_03010 [Novosphingobium pokkalii]